MKKLLFSIFTITIMWDCTAFAEIDKEPRLVNAPIHTIQVPIPSNQQPTTNVGGTVVQTPQVRSAGGTVAQVPQVRSAGGGGAQAPQVRSAGGGGAQAPQVRSAGGGVAQAPQVRSAGGGVAQAPQVRSAGGGVAQAPQVKSAGGGVAQAPQVRSAGGGVAQAPQVRSAGGGVAQAPQVRSAGGGVAQAPQVRSAGGGVAQAPQVKSAGGGGAQVQTKAIVKSKKDQNALDVIRANNASSTIDIDSKYYIQVAAFGNIKNALRTLKSLRRESLQAKIVPITLKSGVILYRVRIYNLMEKANAEMIVENIHGKGFPTAKVYRNRQR